MFALLVAAVTLAADQFVKYIVRMTMIPGESIPIIPGIFHLTYIRNAGAAFGVLPHQNYLFLGIVLVLCIAFICFWKRIPPRPLYFPLGIGLLLGGALGNAVDRVRFDSVIDFLDFRVWPIFNIADMAICLGAALIAIYFWRHSS